MDYNMMIRRICEAGLTQKIETNPEQWQRSLRLSGMGPILDAEARMAAST
jgi:hypothetical protein